MKEYYVLQDLCKRFISCSLCSQTKKDRNQNNFQPNFSKDEICILVDLINKRLEELADEKEKCCENN